MTVVAAIVLALLFPRKGLHRQISGSSTSCEVTFGARCLIEALSGAILAECASKS